MKFLLLISSFALCINVYSQQFGWGDSGYIQGSGGGFYTNVDGNGTDVTISGFVKDYTTNGTGCMKTGINDQQNNSVQHIYQLDFSQPVDLWFTISNINFSESTNTCYHDELSFSGTPIFSNDSKVSINGNIVTPTGGDSSNGTVTVSYSDVQSIAIIHGAGIFCNPGYIDICALNFENLTTVKHVYEEEIRIYPNPSKQFVNVEFMGSDFSKKKLMIYNSLGEIVYSQTTNSSTQIDLSHLFYGLYILSIEQNGQVVFKKIQIE